MHTVDLHNRKGLMATMSAPGHEQAPVPNGGLTLSDLSRLRVLPTPEGFCAGKTYLIDTSFTRVFLDTGETGEVAR